MSNYADEPLTRVTVNLYKSDLEWLKEKSKSSQSDAIRAAIRYYVQAMKGFEDDA